MKALRHPREAAQMPFSRGNIYATPPGDYNSFKSHSLYIKNIEGDVSQGVVSMAGKQAQESHPRAWPMLPAELKLAARGKNNIVYNILVMRPILKSIGNKENMDASIMGNLEQAKNLMFSPMSLNSVPKRHQIQAYFPILTSIYCNNSLFYPTSFEAIT
jgi:hypothetical protein